jgi:hypothetical protein
MNIINDISKSLPKNYLGLFSDTGEVSIDKTISVLETSKTELALAFNLSVDQMRQERLTGKAKERVEQLAIALEYVAETFQGDLKPTLFWIRTPNLNFGGLSPKQLILKGKSKKVIDFILTAKSESSKS